MRSETRLAPMRFVFNVPNVLEITSPSGNISTEHFSLRSTGSSTSVIIGPLLSAWYSEAMLGGLDGACEQAVANKASSVKVGQFLTLFMTRMSSNAKSARTMRLLKHPKKPKVPRKLTQRSRSAHGKPGLLAGGM